MRHYKLSKDQIAANGFTDLFVVSADDLTVTTDDLLQNIALDTLMLGDVVRNHTLLEIKKIIAPQPSANAAVTASVGRTGAGYVDCLAASALMAAGTATPVKTAYAAGEAIADQVIAADNTVLYCQVDINDADGDLATITAGEIWIWTYIDRTSERPPLGAA